MDKPLEIYSVNCEACGAEVFNVDLQVVKLSVVGGKVFKICSECLKKSAFENYRDASSIFRDVVKIASEKGDPEERLQKILELVGE